MQWETAMASVTTLERGGCDEVDVRGVQYDSRRVCSGDVFVALRGETTDGNRFLAQAVSQGAAAVLTDSAETFSRLRSEQPSLPVGLVKQGRRALAEISSAVFDRPQDKLKITAVTGTNGKTTTAFLLEQLLSSAGRKCVLLGTIENHIAGQVRASEHTTPEPRDLLAFFREGVNAGCTEAVMEMSSHALDQERVWGIAVDVGIFTNLTQDHLDYHGTMDRYREAKARMFAGVGAPAPRVAVINSDDASSPRMVAAAGDSSLMTFGIEQGEWRAEDLDLRAGATGFVWKTPHGEVGIQSPLTGRVNVYNLLAASCAAFARGLSVEQIAAAAISMKQVPGRFEVVPGSGDAGFTVVVDYAHTDDALRNLLSLARGLVSGHGGRVVTMFGCGGDRDRTKRPKMGRAAGAESDLAVLTSDNPRSEEPLSIIDEVLVGVRETHTAFVVEPDRRAAIEVAIRAARPGDIVLLAGKGHEKEQVFASGPIAFDDVAEAECVFSQLRNEAAQ